MTGMQWDENQFLELTGGKDLTPHEQYRLGRDTPAPYTPPPPAPAEQPKGISYESKQFAFCAAVIGGTITVCTVASQGAFTAAAAVLSNVLAWGAGVGAVVVILRTAFSWKPETETSAKAGEAANSKTINISVNVAGESVTVNNV